MNINKSNSQNITNDILKQGVFAGLTAEKAGEVFAILTLSKKDYFKELDTLEKLDLEIAKQKENLEKFNEIFSKFNGISFGVFENERKKIEDLIKFLETKKSRLETNKNVNKKFSIFSEISSKREKILKISGEINEIDKQILGLRDSNNDNEKSIANLTSIVNEKIKDIDEIRNRINEIKGVLSLYKNLSEQYKNKKNKGLYGSEAIEVNNENIEKSEKEIKRLEKKLNDLRELKKEKESEKVSLYILNKNNSGEIDNLNKEKEVKQTEIKNLENEIDSLINSSKKSEPKVNKNEIKIEEGLKSLPYLGEKKDNDNQISSKKPLEKLTPQEEAEILKFNLNNEQRGYFDLSKGNIKVEHNLNGLTPKSKYDFSSENVTFGDKKINFGDENMSFIDDSIHIGQNSVIIAGLEIPRDTSDENFEDNVLEYENKLNELSETYTNNPYFSNKISDLENKLKDNNLTEKELSEIGKEIEELEKEISEFESKIRENFGNLEMEIKENVEGSLLDKIFEKFNAEKDKINQLLTKIGLAFSEVKNLFSLKKKEIENKKEIDEFSLDNFDNVPKPETLGNFNSSGDKFESLDIGDNLDINFSDFPGIITNFDRILKEGISIHINGNEYIPGNRNGFGYVKNDSGVIFSNFSNGKSSGLTVIYNENGVKFLEIDENGEETHFDFKGNPIRD